MLDPSIWTDPGFMELSVVGRLLYIGLIGHADDEGKGIGSVKCLKAEIFPSDDGIDTVLLSEEVDNVQKQMQVVFYERNGQEYYKLLKWKSYQYVQHPHRSVIPDPPKNKEQYGNSNVPVRSEYGNDTVPVRSRSHQIDRKIDREINKGAPPSASPSEVNSPSSNPRGTESLLRPDARKQLTALAKDLQEKDPEEYKKLLMSHPELEEDPPFDKPP
jgi:hypothetical protein